MKASLIPIGNSRGVRIPKPLIRQCGLSGEVEMDVHENAIVIRAPTKVRQGWEQAFAQMARRKDDKMLDTTIPPTRFDDEEWQWT